MEHVTPQTIASGWGDAGHCPVMTSVALGSATVGWNEARRGPKLWDSESNPTRQLSSKGPDGVLYTVAPIAVRTVRLPLSSNSSMARSAPPQIWDASPLQGLLHHERWYSEAGTGGACKHAH
eukprot:5678300-Prymnesium_polylepis.1